MRRVFGSLTARPVLLVVVPVLLAGCATTRPSPAVPPGAVATTPVPVGTTKQVETPSPSAVPSRPADPQYVFPVRAKKVAYHPTHAAYPGTDIFADCGEPVVAVTDGRILEVSRVDRFDRRGPRGPFNGGLFVSMLGDDGVRYYGSHLSVVATDLGPGVRVEAGRLLGRVGRTGNANNVCHLHFGMSPPCPGADGWWIRRGVIWPAPYLDAWRKGVDRTPAAEVAAWRAEMGCPTAPAATRNAS